MKKLLQIALIFLMFISTGTFAQESIIPEIKYADLERYIALAKQNFPRQKLFQTRSESVKTGIPMSQLAYLDIFTGSYFYRPDQQSVLDPVNPYNVNGFQFGVNVNLGNFLQKPFQVKKAKADYKIAKLEEEEYNIQLAMEVKRRYYDYIQQNSQVKIYTQNLQENKQVTDGLRNKFERGEITLDVYSLSRINLATAATAKIQAEASYLKAKDSLEEIIGVKLSEVK